MTIHRDPWIECDAEGCVNAFGGSADMDLRRLQAEARAAGWKVDRFNPAAHLCPDYVVSRGAA